MNQDKLIQLIVDVLNIAVRGDKQKMDHLLLSHGIVFDEDSLTWVYKERNGDSNE